MTVVLAVLVALLLVINKNSDVNDSSTDTGESTESYTVSQLDLESIRNISYTNEGEELSFTLVDSVWQYDKDEKFPLDTKSVEELAEALSLVEAQKQIEGKAADSSEYGLDEPSHTVKVTLENGDIHTFYIGDYNRHSSLYYLSYDKSDKVYMVDSSFASVFTLEEADFLVLEEMDSITADSVTAITAEGSFGEITLRVKETDGEKVYTHINAHGAEQELESEGAETIIKALSAVSLTKCADYYAEGEELVLYGLDEASRTKVSISYSTQITTTDEATGVQESTEVDKTCVYYIGKAIAESEENSENNEENTQSTEKTYLVLENSKMIFEVSISSAASFFEAEAD